MISKEMKPKNKLKILMTGATGYLGSRLVKALIKNEEYELVILKRSFSNVRRIAEIISKLKTYDLDVDNLDEVIANNQVDVILHCATDYGRKDSSIMQIIEANLLLPLRLLELGRKYGVMTFINTDTILDKRVSYYSLSKQQLKDWLISYKENMVCVNVPLEHFYGPCDDQTKFTTYVIKSMIENTSEINLTPGEQKRDFIFIDDVVEAFLVIIKNSINQKNGFYEYQLASGSPVSIKEFVYMVKKLSQNQITKLNFGALPYRPNEVMNYNYDLTNIHSLGWRAMVSLEDGLRNTIESDLLNL